MLGSNHLGNPGLQGDKDVAKRISFGVDGRTRTVIADDPDMPLLYALRNDLGVTGPKFGCGLAQCGACTVIINGEAIRSCSTPVADVEGHKITTIGGLRPSLWRPC